MKPRVALFGGLGFPLTETPAGMFRLRDRLLAAGFDVMLTSWDDRQGAANFMHGYTGKRGTAGDSLGAGSAGEYPVDWGGDVDYAAGFQPSMDDARTHSGMQVIARNIVRAHCIYDPWWIDTLGLGQAHWVEAQGAKTKLMVTQHRGAHPDDWGYSQDMVFNELHTLLEAPPCNPS